MKLLGNVLRSVYQDMTYPQSMTQKSIPESYHIYTKDTYENVCRCTFVIGRSVAEWVSTLTPPRMSALLESVWDPGYTAW